MQGLFITGTDTGVGKTYIASQIARELVAQKFNVVPRKPVESGCSNINGQLIPEDAQQLMLASQYKDGLDKVCPYRFEPAISPAQAARLAQQKITLTDLVTVCETDINLLNSFLLVEGAGGFMSPMCEDTLNADLAVKLKLPVVIVVEHKLGCINQTLMAINAVKKYSLDIHSIVLNSKSSSTCDPSSIDEIKTFTSIPIYQCSHNESLKSHFYNFNETHYVSG